VRQEPPSPRIRELLTVALRHHQAGRLNEAEGLYRQVLHAEPQNADALHFLGVLAHQAGRNDQAVELISQAIAQNACVPAFHNNLGNALKAQGQLSAAAESYRRALAQKPDYVEALYNLGVTLQTEGRWEEAADSYRRALSLNSRHAEAHNNLGNILHAQGQLEAAVASYRGALSCRPNYLEAQLNLGNALKARGQLAEALASYLRVLALKPDCAQAHNNLGMVLLQQNKLEEAEAAYGRALACKPDYTEAYNNLGNVLQEQGKRVEAAAAYRRALALEPDYAEARLGLAVADIPVFTDTVAESNAVAAQFARSLDELAAWHGANRGALGPAVGMVQPFFLAYRPFDVTAALARYGDLVCDAAAAYWPQHTYDTRAARPPRDRIRLGIVSGQVRAQHPVWEIVLRGIVAHLDRREFEVFIYHTGTTADEETAWAASHSDRFVQGPKSTQAWLDELSRDRPDVLFYPEVGMDPATCALAALRLAPLQVVGWGHPVTTGLPTLDLFVSGELLEGPGAEQHYREQLVRLPGTGVCTELVPIQPQPWEAPARNPAAVRFVLCQQPIKFDPAHDALLSRIAKAVGPSEFWFASPHKLPWSGPRLLERMATAFRADGLDPQAHLRLLPWLPRRQFAGFLDEMDVYLDCPGFSGYTTAWQAAHRGVPIVTVEGQFMRQRLAAGLLRQIGMTEGIAASCDEYVGIAVRSAEESRRGAARDARREAIRTAASKADGNRSAVDAFAAVIKAR
jgi:protein O-GlcNAc transferase